MEAHIATCPQCRNFFEVDESDVMPTFIWGGIVVGAEEEEEEEGFAEDDD